jgi:hypothetical protein
VEELPSLSHSVTCKFHPLFTLRKTARVLLSLSLTLGLNKERDFSSPEIELPPSFHAFDQKAMCHWYILKDVP